MRLSRAASSQVPDRVWPSDAARIWAARERSRSSRVPVRNARAEAASFYLEAASAALASYQLVLAARYYRRAVKLAPRLDPSRLAAFEALETIARIQGKWRERRRYLASLRQLARDNERPYWVAVALIRTARFDLDAGRLARGLTLANCGCFGVFLARPLSWESPLEDLVALALCGFLWWLAPDPPPRPIPGPTA